MPTLSIILPCFNEEDVITTTVGRVMKWIQAGHSDAEVIVVNNASTDNTLKVLDNLCQQYPLLRVVRRDVNGGCGASVRSGCDAARGEIIAYMDSDGQFAVEDFDLLLSHLSSTDFVSGIRAHREDPRMRLILSGVWNMVNRVLFRLRARDIDCGMKAFRRGTWPVIRPVITIGDAFNAELYFRLQKSGLRWTQVPVRHFPRLTGKSGSVRVYDMFKAISETLHLFFATCCRKLPRSPSSTNAAT
ncbi:MAG: glycosyltransferase family 2 protein [Candidatus Peregrinibacteria bacterium]